MKPISGAGSATPLPFRAPGPTTASGREAYTWPPHRVSVTRRAGAACQPDILEVSGLPGGRSLRVRVSHPVTGSITATIELTLHHGRQALRYRGCDNLRRGTGTVHLAGPPLPDDLTGSAVEVAVDSCEIYALSALRPPAA
ncbi:hypothetical protein KTR66_02605 [Roseococcus sp. SDR]|uniref:hypothetical protein n=1 Tax=Roseococcus sp. SDR TaxID=2835532 RepID=UPI001BD058FB|nr:hypothetical protein [Roseococcus sp. SDR]MBS7788868.1 hypothetical protein [Roseococcus sp. SDR]MBV1844182.1 hypothetical protein [Roseococcus sp. SDR]